MNLYKRVLEVVDYNLILCLIPIVLTLIIVEIFFEKRFETKKVLKIVTKIILIYAIFKLIYSLTGFIFYHEKFAFIKKAAGSYSWAFYIMFFSASVLPLTLLIRKLSNKFFYVLFVAIFMKIGFYFEHFAMIGTSFQQNYQTKSSIATFTESFAFGFIIVSLQGIIITIIFLGFFEATKNLKNKGFINGL